MPKLSDLCEIKINFPEADFWLLRRGKIEEVGKPLREFSGDHIGVKVIATDKLVPAYLRYWFEFAHGHGTFRSMALKPIGKPWHQGINVKITAQMIADLPIEQK